MVNKGVRMRNILVLLFLLGIVSSCYAATKFRIDRVQEYDNNVIHIDGNRTIVQAGTGVPFIFTNQVSTSTLNVNGSIPIKVERNVYTDSTLIFEEGATGCIYAKEVKKARRLGKQGQLYFSDGYVKDTKGIERRIVFDEKYTGKRCKWANIIGSVMIWNPIGWIVMQKKGGDVSIPIGTRATSITGEDFGF